MNIIQLIELLTTKIYELKSYTHKVNGCWEM